MARGYRKYSKTKARIVTGNKYYYDDDIAATAKKHVYHDEMQQPWTFGKGHMNGAGSWE